MNRFSRGRLGIGIIGSCLLLGLLLSSIAPRHPPLFVGQVAAPFELPGAQGGSYRLRSSDAAGTMIVFIRAPIAPTAELVPIP